MKVLALVTDGFGGYGGIAQYNRDFINGLASQDAVTSVLVLPRLADKLSAEVRQKVRQEPPISGRLLYSIRALVAAFRYAPDLVFCGHLFMAPLAWLLATLLRTPWWLQIHGIEAWDRPGVSAIRTKDSFPDWFPIRRLVETADLVTAVSRFTRRRFLTWADISPEKVRVLPNTIGLLSTHGPCDQQLKEELKARHGLANRRILLTVSRIDRGDRYKGHDKVLAVLPQLLMHDPTLVYVVVGDGDNRTQLERSAQELVPAANIRFTGRVSDEQLSDYYRMADVFVMPSAKEGFGIVFLEAALHGLAVVAGNADGSSDACLDGAIGTCIDPTDPKALLSAMRSALGGVNGQGAALVVERFGPQRYKMQLSSLLSSAMGR